MSEEDVNKFFAGLDPQNTPATTAAPSTNQLQASDTGAGAPMPSPTAATQAEPEPAPADAPPQFVPLEIPQAKVPELTQEQIKPVDYSQRDQAFQQHLEALRHPLAKLPDAAPPSVEKPKQNLFEQMTKPLFQFGKGVLGGNIDVADNLNALAQTPGKLGPKEGSKPQEDFGQQYERNFGKGDVGSAPYEAGRMLGQMGTYGAASLGTGAIAAAAGLPVAGAGALGLGAAGLEGAAQGAGQDAREQLRKTGRVSDTSGFAGNAALGAGIGVAGGVAGNVAAGAARKIQGGVQKFAGEQARKVFEKLGDTADSITDDAIELIKKSQMGAKEAQKFIDEIKNEVLAHEIEGLNQLGKTFYTQPPAENAYQQAQRAILAKEAKSAATPANLRQTFKYGTSGRETVVNYPSELESKLVQYISRIKRSETGRNPRPFPEQAQMRDAIASELGVDGKEVYGIAAKYHASVKEGAEAASHTTEVFNAPPARPEAKAPFRLRTFKKGFEDIDHAMDLAEAAAHMPGQMFQQFKNAVEAMGDAKAARMHFQNEVDATGQNALAHARDKEQLAKIFVDKDPRLKSEASEELSKERFRLFQEQRQREISNLTGGLREAALDHFKDIPMGKYLYGVANGADEFKMPTNLANNFDDAYKQFVDAHQALKAATKQYEALAEHFKPIFEDAEKAFQQSKGTDLERLYVKTKIRNPFNAYAQTDFAIGLKFEPHVAKLYGLAAEQYKVIHDAIYAQEGNVVGEIAYKLGGMEKLTKQSGKDAIDKLREMGVLHPVAQRLALAAAISVRALDAPAEAYDGTPKEQKQFFSNLSNVLVASILVKKFGVPMAQQIIKMPQWQRLRMFGNTRDIAGFADKALGISSKGESMAHNMSALAGKVVEAVMRCPDDTQYLLKAVKSEVDLKHVSPLGQQFVKEIRDEAKAFKNFVREYHQEWNKQYRSWSPEKQQQLLSEHACIDFIHRNFARGPRVMGEWDRRFSGLFGNAAEAWFTLNPKIWLGSVADLGITNTLQTGPVAVIKAAMMQGPTGDPIIKQLMGAVHLGGSRSQALNSIAQKPYALASETIQNRTATLASLIKFFHENPAAMIAEKSLGTGEIKTEEEFIRRALTGKLSTELNADAFIQLAADLADTVGTDPTDLIRGPFGRSALGDLIKFTNQPERFLRLMALRATTKPQWVAASLGVLHQIGGHAILPVGAQLAGYGVAGEGTAKLIAMIDQYSTGQQVGLGMSNMLSWDPFLTPFMGVAAPGLDTVLETLGDWHGTSSALGEVFYDISQGGKSVASGDLEGAARNPLVGNPQVEANQKAQHALYTLLQKLAIAEPMMALIPTRALANFAYYAPAAIHGVARVSVPAPIHMGRGQPLKPTEVKRFDGAAEQSWRQALGLGDSFRVSLYKTANSVPKSERSEVLRDLKRESGIF